MLPGLKWSQSIILIFVDSVRHHFIQTFPKAIEQVLFKHFSWKATCCTYQFFKTSILDSHWNHTLFQPNVDMARHFFSNGKNFSSFSDKFVIDLKMLLCMTHFPYCELVLPIFSHVSGMTSVHNPVHKVIPNQLK